MMKAPATVKRKQTIPIIRDKTEETASLPAISFRKDMGITTIFLSVSSVYSLEII